MIEFETFKEDVKNCSLERVPLIDNITDSGLEEIHRLFMDADAVSRESQDKTKRYRISIVLVGVFITILFIYYGEGRINNFFVSGGCLILIALSIGLENFVRNKRRHTKHLQYRVLAELLRAQFYISYCGINEKVVEMLPKAIAEESIPWVANILNDLPETDSTNPNAVWLFCRNQIDYHNKNYHEDISYYQSYEKWTKVTAILTIVFYFAAFVFDFYLLAFTPNGLNLNDIYFKIQLALGLISMIMVLTSNYYGKMSLETRIKEHRRGLYLYQSTEIEILKNGLIDEEFAQNLLLELVRQFLIEVSIWYVYESQNKIETNI